jgi:hypothetical protein
MPTGSGGTGIDELADILISRKGRLNVWKKKGSSQKEAASKP